ncbi:MAG: hypothetical protein HY308_02190 [Gammaproteobacteria bacterium]|nr:hypothetical protein [Gammaproteobacteria bacterium]
MRPLHGVFNDDIKIVLIRRQRRICRLYRLPAVIVRWTREDAGLMFSNLTPNVFYALLALLLADEQRLGMPTAISATGQTSRPHG